MEYYRAKLDKLIKYKSGSYKLLRCMRKRIIIRQTTTPLLGFSADDITFGYSGFPYRSFHKEKNAMDDLSRQMDDFISGIVKEHHRQDGTHRTNYKKQLTR